MTKYSEELEIAVSAALEAGGEIMDVYNNTEDINFEKKSDNSPLTIADKRSHDKIMSFLKETNINIISEESKSVEYDDRKNWEEYWLVDPLDGTKEFIKKTESLQLILPSLETINLTLELYIAQLRKLFTIMIMKKMFLKR